MSDPITSKEPTTSSPVVKRKMAERPPSRNLPTTPPTLQQYKTSIENAPGPVKNATDARKYLEQKQWTLPQQHITCSHLARVLFSLVSIQGQATHKTTDKLTENTANTITSVALLLEEAVVAQYVGQIMDQLSWQSGDNNPTNNATSVQVKDSIDTLSATVQESVVTLQKAIDEIKLSPSPAQLTPNPQPINPKYSYRDALLSNRQITHTLLSTPYEAKLQNRLNIDALQALIEIQSENDNPLKDNNPSDECPTGKLKAVANNWLANRDGDDPPPPNTVIRALTQYSNKKILLEANTKEAAEWIRQNASRIFQPLIGHPVKTLGRLYPVIARFMPVLFQTNKSGIHKLESSANLTANSITNAMWIKHPNQRSKGQLFANLKILCTSAEVANSLIIGSGRISHLGSQIQFSKNVRAPGTCNHCQLYGHTATRCKAPAPVCATCGDNHFSSECRAQTTKCTPCGLVGHRTNSDECPQHILREDALRTKRPELLTPYFITAERWTWGLTEGNTPPQEANEETTYQYQRRKPLRSAPRQRQAGKEPAKTQRTLLKSGFQRRTMQTGANSIPINPKNTPNNALPSSSTQPQVRSLPTQHTNTLDSEHSPQNTPIPQ